MLTRIATLCTVLALAGVLADDARAQARTEQETQLRLTQRDYGRGGYFIAASGIYAIENSPLVAGSKGFISSGGFNIRLGHRHNRWWATELNGLYVHRFRADDGSFLAWGLGVNERLHLTKSRVQPYLLVGIGFLQVESRGDVRVPPGEIDTSPGFTPGFSARFGLGAEVYTTENFAMTLDAVYHLTAGNIRDHDFATVGLGMVFF